MTRRRRIALVVNSLEGEFSSTLLSATTEIARQKDVEIVAVSGGILDHPEEGHGNFVYNLLGPGNVDGVILATATIGHSTTESRLLRLIENFGVPTVSLGVTLGSFPSLHIDNEHGMHELTNHLIHSHNLRRIAFISGPPSNQESIERQRGVEQALLEHGLELDPDLIVEGTFRQDSGERAIATLFDQRGLSTKDVDAIMCANDDMAIGALDALERRNIRVPRDVALTGFDDVSYAQLLRVPLTTIRQPLSGLVTTAIETILGELSSGTAQATDTSLRSTMITRRSCGCVRRTRETRPSDIVVGTGRPFREAVVARFTNFRRDLDAVVRARLDETREEWDTRLATALATQVEKPYKMTVFVSEVEELLSDIVRRGGSVSRFQDALLNLRRLAMQATSAPDQKLVVDDAFDDALVLASEMSAMAQAKKRYETMLQLRTFNDVTAALLAAPDLSALSRAGAQHLPRVGIESAVISLFGTEPEQLDVHMSFDRTGPQFDTPSFPIGDLAPAHLLSADVCVVLPLSVPGDQLGIAAFEYGAEDGAVYERLRQVISAAVQGARLTQAVEQARQIVALQAITDALTGLYNRRHFFECLDKELAEALAQEQPLSLLVLDLDGFKQVNDEFGHDEGDRLLMRVGKQLLREVRDSDIVARFGGDEFVAVLPNTSTDIAERVANRIVSRLKHARSTDKASMVSASVGVATTGEQIRDAKILFRAADQALLAAKQAGKDQVVVGKAQPSPSESETDRRR